MIIKYNNKVVSSNSRWVGYTHVDPYNPLNLPPYTIRLKYTDGVTPTFSKGTAVQVSSSPNVWDLTYENSNWSQLLYTHSDLLEILGANSTGVTNMGAMFDSCTSLVSVPLFDTSSITNMGYMFGGCESLESVPLFDTSSVTNMNSMFGGCESLVSVPLFDTSNVTDISYAFHWCPNVQSGALALYQQASTQSNPPFRHMFTFYSCGSNTTTGAAELSQIPSDWK